MDPRLKSSKKWSPLPEELCEQISEVFTERFTPDYEMDGYRFLTEGRIYPEEIILRVGLGHPDRLRQHNFELSVEYDKEKEKAFEKINQCLDIMEPIWEDFFEEDMADKEFPRQWDIAVKSKKGVFFYRYTTVNTELEKQADVLLEQYDKKLVYDEGEDENLPDNETNVNLH